MKIVLVDDEQLALDYLKRQLMKLTQIDIIGTYTNPYFAKEVILKQDVHVVFMDISLPEISGIELAEQILEIKPHIHIVFVTAYYEYAVKAFELNALDYLVKPVRAERLAKTMERINESVEIRPTDEELHTESLRLNLFKQVSVDLSGNQRVFLQWRTTKAQELFLYLLQHRGQLVRKSTLIELLWPEHDPDKVYAQLYTTVYHIRKTLEVYGPCFQISNATEGYLLTLNKVTIDVEEWESQVTASLLEAHGGGDPLAETLKGYTGDYLQEYDYWWAESERQRLKELWLEACYAAADRYERQGEMNKAIAGYMEICNKHPIEEKANFILMNLYADMQNEVMIRKQYQSLRTKLFEELSEEPSPYITEWYNQWEAKTNIS